MPESFRLVALPNNPNQRKLVYHSARPAFLRRYGKTDGPLAFKHAKRVAEDVARYTAKSKDKHWAGMCIILAALHPLDANVTIPRSLMLKLSSEDRSMLQKSLLNLNILRAQDEAPAEAKDPRVYKTLMQAYRSRNGFMVLAPEVFVRVVDMSEFQFFTGKEARELHKVTSHGVFPAVVQNMAHSVRTYWRRAAIQLMLFDCYDKQSNIAANILHHNAYVQMRRLFRELRQDFQIVKECFSKHLEQIVSAAEAKGIPIVRKTDRETGSQVPFLVRQKTPGSATFKAIKYSLVDADGEHFDQDAITEGVHDLLASTLVSLRACDAEGLYSMVTAKDKDIIVEKEAIFYKGCRISGNSDPDYHGVGHIDYDAAAFGATQIRRAELHVRSFESDHAYYHGKAGRGLRGSTEFADAWGDKDSKIVENIGLNY